MTLLATVVRARFRHLIGHRRYRLLRHSQSRVEMIQTREIDAHDWLCRSGRYRRCPIK